MEMTEATFDVYWAQGLYEANCSKERVAEMTGVWDHDNHMAAEGYANDYVDVYPVCIMPHGIELHAEGVAHIEANGPK